MKFETWLQTRLIAHGAKIAPDGDWGRGSIAALEAFQRSKNLPATGVADDASVKALRRTPGAKSTTATLAPQATENMPPWMSELDRRQNLHEVRNNGTLTEFLQLGRFLGNPKDLPWCGDAVESAMAKTLPRERLPSNPFWAQAWAKFGIDAGGPLVGSVGVIRWTSSTGHVGIVAGMSGSRVLLLGGNQRDAINISSFPRSKFIAFRWPSTFPIRNYPPLQGTAPAANEKGTR